MSLIDEKFIDIFAEWAERNEDIDVFPKISKGDETYYANKTFETTYIMEYSIVTAKKLREDLKEYSQLTDDQELVDKLTIGICQNRYKSAFQKNGEKESSMKEKNDAEETLTDYRYIF